MSCPYFSLFRYQCVFRVPYCFHFICNISPWMWTKLFTGRVFIKFIDKGRVTPTAKMSAVVSCWGRTSPWAFLLLFCRFRLVVVALCVPINLHFCSAGTAAIRVFLSLHTDTIFAFWRYFHYIQEFFCTARPHLLYTSLHSLFDLAWYIFQSPLILAERLSSRLKSKLKKTSSIDRNIPTFYFLCNIIKHFLI